MKPLETSHVFGAAIRPKLARIIQPMTLSSRKPRFGVTGLRFRRFPDTPLHHRRQASVWVEEGLRFAGKGLMFGAPRPAS
ncbi:MAG TPA: hypothetical protein VGO84_04825 [Burkholderiales bacterium]|nr:hypothetical protein [Burkholderiales bacterium]